MGRNLLLTRLRGFGGRKVVKILRKSVIPVTRYDLFLVSLWAFAVVCLGVFFLLIKESRKGGQGVLQRNTSVKRKKI